MTKRNGEDVLHTIGAFLEQLDAAFQAHREPVVPIYPYDPDTETIKLPEKVDSELKELLRQERHKGLMGKVAAIKRVTKLTGAGLRVSKAYVDNLLREMEEQA